MNEARYEDAEPETPALEARKQTIQMDHGDPWWAGKGIS